MTAKHFDDEDHLCLPARTDISGGQESVSSSGADIKRILNRSVLSQNISLLCFYILDSLYLFIGL